MTDMEEKLAWEKSAAKKGVVLHSVDCNNLGHMEELCEMLGVKGVAATSRLRAHIKSLQRKQQPTIFSHGLPPLGPLSQTTRLPSNPSLPTEEQHKAARLKISNFTALSPSNLGNLTTVPTDNIWNRFKPEKGHLGGYSNEAGVNMLVERVINDVLDTLGVADEVMLRHEVEVMSNRPDFLLILVNGHPIGTIEGKQPGTDAMEHPNILGEVYDQLLHLRSIFRVDAPFAILTCYNQWRICWLDELQSMERAYMEKLPNPIAYVTPMKQNKSLANNGSEDNNNNMHPENKEESPPLPDTPSRTKAPTGVQSVDDSQSSVEDEALHDDDYPRTFCGTDIMEWSDKALPLMLASVILKMMLAKQKGLPVVVRLANQTTSAWKRAPKFNSLRFDLCISGRVKNFYFWEDLGHGADGKAFLVSGGTKGAVGVLKFFHTNAERKAEHELQMWKKVYSHLPSVEKTVRILQVMGHTALLMPWFQSPSRTQSDLTAVETTLREGYMAKGICHDDVAWRNVGVYRDNGQTKAVVFDMQRVRCVKNNQHVDWVTDAVERLSQKLVGEQK